MVKISHARLSVFSLIFLLFSVCSLQAQNIWLNDINASNPSSSNPFTAGQEVAANLTVSGIGRGSGISGNAGSNRYNASGWPTANSINSTDYFYFTLTPDSGYYIDFTQFQYTGQKSSTGPSNFAVRSSLDNYASNIYTTTSLNGTVSLSSSQFDNITTAITFRVYGYSAGSGSGTYSINDFVFTGTVNQLAIPPAITGNDSQSFDYATGGSYDFTVTGSPTPTVSAALTAGGSLPDGITLDTTNTLVNLAGTVATGTYNITITATNTNGSATKDVSLTVNAVAPILVTNTFSEETDATSSTATFSGSVTNNGGTTISARGFVYNQTGIGLDAGSATTVTDTDDSDALFTETVSGLSANSQYYYRAFATNTAGTAYGSTNSFYTHASTPLAPTVTTVSANELNVALNANSATLYAISINGGAISGYLNTDGSVSATAVWSAAANWASVAVTGLTPETSYAFAVNAQNVTGTTTGFGPSASAATSAATEPYIVPVDSALSYGEVCIDATNDIGYITFSGVNFDTPATLMIASDTPDGLGGYEALSGFSFGISGGSFSDGTYSLANFDGTEVTIEVHFTPTSVGDYSPENILLYYNDGSDNVALYTFEIADATGINTPVIVNTVGYNTVTQFSATAEGAITQGCSTITTYGVEYSIEEGFTEGTGTIVTSDDISGSDFSAAITGLSPCTTYYYHAFATDATGTVYGGELSFTTEAIDTPVTLEATSITQIGFTANWQAVAGAASYTLEVSTTDTFSSADSYTPTENTLELTGLQPGTVYYYRVTATAGCTSAYSETITVTTSNYLSTTENTAVFGDVCTNSQANGYFTFTGDNLADAIINVAALNGFSYSLTEAGAYNSTLTINGYNGEALTVYVQFAPSAIQSYNGNIVISGDTPYELAILNVPVTGNGINVTAQATTSNTSDITSDSVTLNGNAIEGSCATLNAYGFEYSTTDGFSDGSGIQLTATGITGAGAFAYALSGLEPCTTYYFKSFATDIEDLTFYSTQSAFTTSALGAPVAESVSDITANSFTATWQPVEGAIGYTIEVSTSPQFGTYNYASDLFISEYIEGTSGYEKYIEVYNGTGAAIDLSDYRLRLYANGATDITYPDFQDIQLSGTIENGEAVVLGNTQATSYSGFLPVASVNFNGDDAMVLYKISTDSTVDIIGTIGEDPGSAWTSGELSTANQTLIRNTNVFAGVTVNPTGGFPTLGSEWTTMGANYNDFSNLGMHNYEFFTPDNIAGYNGLDAGDVTSITVTGLSEYTTYYFRVTAYTAACSTAASNALTITTKGTVTWTTVDGTPQWVPEFMPDGTTPVTVDSTTPITIETDYNTATDGGLNIESLTLNNGTFTVAEGTSVTITNAIVNNALAENFVIENNANLIQVNDVANTGDVNVYKSSSELYRLDYTLWSAPVTGQNLLDFSPMTVATRFYDYDESQDIYTGINPVDNNFEQGMGYLIRMPNDHPSYVDAETPGTAWTGLFDGNLNNGTITVPMETTFNGYNLVGNPYPSPINIHDFYDANTGTLGSSSALYFWRKRNDESGTSPTYATITRAAYTANSAAGGDMGSDTYVGDPSAWVINVGQGFFVEATGSELVFNNSMRRNVNNGQFFRTAQENNTPIEISRLWMNLTNTQGAFSQMAVAYSNVTTNGIDYGWDGKAFLNDGAAGIFTVAEDEFLRIQARQQFEDTDTVALGYKVTTAGQYTISLDHVDGLFEDGQDIYITDNIADITTNLTQGDYTFTTGVGQFNDRFTVHYVYGALGNPVTELASNNVLVYTQNGQLTVSCEASEIKEITVYDTRGRLLYSNNKVDANQHTLEEISSENQLLILNIVTQNGSVTKKTLF